MLQTRYPDKLVLHGGSQVFACSLQYGQTMSMLSLKSVWKALERMLQGGVQNHHDDLVLPLNEGLIHDELF